ncbi:GNAT family N-acetyltransferase [Myxococcus sp. CA040A]|uniref:GNAT family N-acetyltransferase n=1 Tax=Myxococcus sp. CA040A TaxID=2741738 RepID=UPI00157A74D0|nr:GNAT family N-acetyltransferase [Myxococcus sp. CA040A]NTX06062.1 GNAT family N-acetyltransferase [Myxococcus sp. CA040A]
MAVEARRQPSAWALRPGRASDYETYVRLFAELGVDEPPPSASMWAHEVAPRTLLVDGPGGVEGYTSTDALGELGYVGQLVVAPSARRRGLGRWLMERVAARFREQGCRSWALNVKRDNVAALGLYTSLGMRRARQGINLKVTRAQVAALPPVPGGLVVVPLEAGDWAPLTGAFGMMPGKLARYATLASHRLLRLAREDGVEEAPLGMMDVRSGGAVLFPFFAASLPHARALLEGAFSLLGTSRESMGVVVTDDAPLERILRDAGAGVSLETFELRGALPEP